MFVGVQVSADRSGGSDSTDATGSYVITDQYEWTGTITPSKEDWVCGPADTQ